MQRYWEWLVGRVPSWIAPNLITIIGLATNVFTTLVLVYYCPTATEQVGLPVEARANADRHGGVYARVQRSRGVLSASSSAARVAFGLPPLCSDNLGARGAILPPPPLHRKSRPRSWGSPTLLRDLVRRWLPRSARFSTGCIPHLAPRGSGLYADLRGHTGLSVVP